MYMGYDMYNGPAEGAVLIFANTAREARKLLWKQNLEKYLDVRICLINDSPYLEKEKLHNQPHIVVPEKSTCKKCGMWGIGEIGGDGLCDLCRSVL